MKTKPKPNTVHIRPGQVDLGNGPQPAVIRFRRGEPLPSEGRRVTTLGAEGDFWRRRIAEGGVVLVEPETPKVAATEPEQPRAASRRDVAKAQPAQPKEES